MEYSNFGTIQCLTAGSYRKCSFRLPFRSSDVSDCLHRILHEMSMVLPPNYFPTPSPPRYSYLLPEGEETVEFTPRGNAPTNVLTKIRPRNVPLIAGALQFMLKGRLRVSISDSGSATIPVVSESAVLWSRDSAHKDLCPSVLPFSIAFPTTFKHGDRVRSIPPSFSEAYYQLPAISAQCSYILKVTIHNSSKMAFWKPSRSYSLWLNYRPRTRPQRPVFHLDRFLATLKQIPEDWLELESTMRIRRTDSPDLKPISYLFKLGVITASVITRNPEFGNRATQRSSIHIPTNDGRSQYAKMLENGNVGGGKGADTYVDWEGEVRVEKDMVQYGGFNIGTVIVKDYIVFAITPPNPRSCPLLAHQHSVPIKLVTDLTRCAFRYQGQGH
ncbi:hypothetical protein LENED_006003 [Lentinula edodes]|uniref:Uncharacterized protein n=1 Tax=Lentinula edodes TaxID=5353 RepID=A0A1Q3EAI1_LENED|nr:hypothetical protein LENED_006003 [Lentinula edodes]